MMNSKSKYLGAMAVILMFAIGSAAASADSARLTLEDALEALRAEPRGPGQTAETISSGPSAKMNLAERISVTGGFGIFDSGVSVHLRSSTLFPPDLVERFELDMTTSVAGREGASDGVALTAGADSVCVSNQRIATCGSLKSAHEGEVLGVTLCGPGFAPGTVEIVGVLPDGAEDVSIRFDGPEDPVSVDVAENVYAATAHGKPVSIAWTMPDFFGPDGKAGADAKKVAHSAILPIPADYSFERCEPGSG